mgnify:FL=1
MFWKIKASPQDHHDSSVLMIPNMWPNKPIIFRGSLFANAWLLQDKVHVLLHRLHTDERAIEVQSCPPLDCHGFYNVKTPVNEISHVHMMCGYQHTFHDNFFI